MVWFLQITTKYFILILLWFSKQIKSTITERPSLFHNLLHCAVPLQCYHKTLLHEHRELETYDESSSGQGGEKNNHGGNCNCFIFPLNCWLWPWTQWFWPCNSLSLSLSCSFINHHSIHKFGNFVELGMIFSFFYSLISWLPNRD